MTDRELKALMRQALDQAMPPLPDDPDLTAKVLERHAEKQQKRRARLTGLRIAAAVAVMALVICGGAIAQRFSYSYIEARYSEDGEQYILAGVSVTPPVEQNAEAELDSSQEPIMFFTKDLDEAIEAIGEIPLMPAWLPDGWELYGYNVVVTYAQKFLTAHYQKPIPGEDDYDALNYEVFIFNDLQYFYMSIEANLEGDYMELDNGMSVYVDMNVERPTSMWYDGLTCYAMSGDVTPEELVQIIHAMYGLD